MDYRKDRIHYTMCLHRSEDSESILDQLAEEAGNLGWGWEWEEEEEEKARKTLLIIPQYEDYVEPLTLSFDNLVCEGWISHFAVDDFYVRDFFDCLWAVRPRLKELLVTNSKGLWEKYQELKERTKDPLSLLRELTTEEKEELRKDFHIPRSQHEFFSPDLLGGDYAEQRIKFLQMVRKDLSEELDSPVDIQEIQEMILSRSVLSSLDQMLSDPYLAYATLTEIWMIKTLTDEAGIPLIEKAEMTESLKEAIHADIGAYAWAMKDLYCESFSGAIGLLHMKINQLLNTYQEAGFDFTNDETFFRIVYSMLEFSGFYRPLKYMRKN
ncbi:MAG: hypothetical protein FWG14_12085 [Peptococcaceae bacterium]|nr:hypothetical protein [Peptococcaceae bacterium]